MPESSNQSQLLWIQKPNNNNKRNIIVALAVVVAVIGILVWSPWVTAEFAQMKLKSYSPCPNLGIGIEYSSPESSTKTFFGRKLTKVDVPFCGTFDFFISATGSVHQMRVYKNEAKETTSPTKKDETADWKTYAAANVVFSKVSYSIKYPKILNEGSLYEEPFGYTKRFSNYKETEGYGATACEGEGKGDDCFTITLSIQDKDGPEEITRDYNFVKSMSVGTTKTDNPKLGDIIYTRHENVTYRSNNWLTYTAQRDPKGKARYLDGFMLKKDGIVYYLNVSSDSNSTIDKNKDLLDKILSTFKFLD